LGTYETVKIEREGPIGWVILNRPDKRNAMNPTMHYEMLDVWEELQFDDHVKIVVLTGEGDSWCAGQDLKESFLATANDPREHQRSSWAASEWRWRRLYYFPKPTIAMVNGYCFGGGFTQLIACDFAFAAQEATFGLSEVNWGSFPGGLVSRVLAEAMSNRDALYYIMTGDTFDGARAAELGLVNAAYPLEQLREQTVAFAEKLAAKNQHTLHMCKVVYKHVKEMSFIEAEDYIWAKLDTLEQLDPGGRTRGIEQFVNSKSYRPGLGSYQHGQ
jgi:trans-feruloyl-CoA hydratase/vanillin synthase